MGYKQVMQQALDCIEKYAIKDLDNIEYIRETVSELHSAIYNYEQDPVAWMWDAPTGYKACSYGDMSQAMAKIVCAVALYAPHTLSPKKVKSKD